MNWLALITRHLPAVARRAGAREAQALAHRLETLGDDHRYATAPTIDVAEEILAQLSDEIRKAQRELAEHLDMLTAAFNEATRTSALTEILLRTRAGQPLVQDIQAMDRWLDEGTIRDRDLALLQSLHQQWAFLAGAMAGAELMAEGTRSAARATDNALAVFRGRHYPWWMREAAAGLLGSLLGVEHSGRGVIRQALLNGASNFEDDPLVQAAALSAYVEARARRGETVDAVLELVAIPPEGSRPTLPADHCFARARAIEICARHHRWTIVRKVLDVPDSSMHVMQTAVRNLAASPDPEALDILNHSLVEAPGTLEPRVRATALVAVLPTEEHSDPVAGAWIELVARGLAPEQDPWVVEVLLRALLDRRAVLEQIGRGPERGSLERASAGDPPGTAHSNDEPTGHSSTLERCWDQWSRNLEHWSSQTASMDLANTAAALQLWLRVQLDRRLRTAARDISSWLADAREGQHRDFDQGPVAGLSPRELLMVLSLAAADHFDLSAESRPRGKGEPDVPPSRGYRIYDGARPGFEWWRFFHEISHPDVGKRQTTTHVTDRIPRGDLVALSLRMAEVSPTAVPGQRCATPSRLDWGAHLPLPSLLVAAAGRPRVDIATPLEHFSVRRTKSPLGAWISAQLRYTHLAAVRNQSLRRPREQGVQEYDRALASAGFSVERHGRLLPALVPWLDPAEIVSHVMSTDSNTLPQLAVLALGLAGYWIVDSIRAQRRTRRHRSSIPLVIGGWGSRGKSGTERLKAGLFHGLGYRVMAKTTGCEAMLIASIPGGEPREIFLYRPNDKATIWEQRRVLEMAATFEAQVLLWECMGLNPEYVEILQRDWMRDDFSTITNTYPDHEDIQGPTGRDVADTVSLFTPRNAHLVTSEQHMLPVVEQRAIEHNSTFTAVRQEEWSLLPQDLVDRIPYSEHPRNIALVVSLARQLEIRPDVALKLMADHVVPDLGVLKEYGPLEHEGRTLSFVNGMSANERAGFISNWDRMGFQQTSPEAGLRDWLTLLVNNRYDRLARQAVFARIAALDAPADAVVVIGTNVGSYYDDYCRELETTLRAQLIQSAGDGAPGGKTALVSELSRRLRRRALGRVEALDQIRRSFPSLDIDAIGAHADRFYSLGEPVAEVSGRLVLRTPGEAEGSPGLDAEEAALQWLREVSWLWLLESDPEGWQPNDAINAFIRLVKARALPLHDPKLTGDQVIQAIASRSPRGARVRILGCQNIKGTGLDFAYRWIGGQKTLELCRNLLKADAPAARAILSGLALYSDFGVMDVALAVETVKEGAESGRLRALGLKDEADATLERLKRIRTRLTDRLRSDHGTSGGWSLARMIEPTIDFYNSIRTRAAADQLFCDLTSLRVSLDRASVVAKTLMDRQKAGWLGKRS